MVPSLVTRSGWFRSVLAVAVALCVLAAGLLAASPELHEHVHHDAGHADHSCLVTAMAAGSFDSVSVTPLLVVLCLALAGTAALMRAQWVRPQFLEGSVLEHGPPVAA